MDEDDLTLIEKLKVAQKNIVVEPDENQSKSAMQQYQEMGYTNVIADYNDGKIIENPTNGDRVFVSPSYITSDDGIIAGIMEGISPSETNTARDQDKFIEDNPIASRAAAALQGIPLIGSYTDEAVGFFNEDAAEAMRYSAKAIEDRKPGQSMALQAGGALAATPAIIAATPAAVTGYVASGLTLLRQMGRAALAGTLFGTVEGAVSGYGRGEGDERIETAKSDALIGGGVGGVTAGVFPAGSAIISSAWSNIKGRSVKEISNKLGISIPSAKVIRVALENDDLPAAQAALDRAGSSSMLADAGPSTGGLLDVSVTSGGKSPRFVREAVESRAEKAGEDMTTVLDNLLGKPKGASTTQKGIRLETVVDRDKIYREAYSKPIDYSGSGGKNIQNFFNRIPSSAIKAANDLMKLEGKESLQILAEIAENGKVTFTRLPDVRQLDYITRALNQVGDQQNATGKLGGSTPVGRATKNLSRSIRNALRKEVPEYADALDKAADTIQRIEAVEAGYSILNSGTTRETVRDAITNLSPVQLKEARQGLRSAIDDTLAKVNAVASDANVEIREFQKLANNLRSRASREKISLLIGEKNASNLYKKLDQAVVTLELRATIARNSATQQRTAITGKVDDITGPNIIDKVLSGEPINAGKRIVQVISGNTPEAITLRKMGIYDEIAGVLVNLRGKEAKNALRLVRKAMDGDALTEQMAERIAKVLASPAAVAIYSVGTSPDVDDQVVPLIDKSENVSTDLVTEQTDAETSKSIQNILDNLDEKSIQKILDSQNQ
tara:strand:- start:41 stop:2389 length:2349 start_codon:yes stop_codon:yes gene_type:complete